MKTIFVAGTGTEVGKTYVVSRLAARFRESGRRVGVYKPVASDCIAPFSDAEAATVNGSELRSSDAEQIWEAAGRPLTLEAVCPQRFRAALAPDEAARREGKRVDADLLRDGAEQWNGHCEILIVEGAGGLFSPIADDWLNIDLFRQFSGAELFLVAGNRLGVIHDVVATIRAAEACGVKVAKLYLSATDPQADASCRSNRSQIQRWIPGLTIEQVAWGGSVE